jgi:two-component system response regulator ChvI
VAKSGKPAANSEAAAPIVCAALVLSQTTYRAYWNQRGMLASPSSEYDIVHLLVSNVGRYQAYRAIYDLQYYEGFVAGQWAQGYRTNVRSSIKRIRKSFADSTRPSQKSRTPPPTDIAGEV